MNNNSEIKKPQANHQNKENISLCNPPFGYTSPYDTFVITDLSYENMSRLDEHYVNLDKDEQLVLMYFIKSFKSRSILDYSQDTIASLLGINRKRANKAISSLHTKGFICMAKRVATTLPRFKYRTNLYWLNPALWTAEGREMWITLFGHFDLWPSWLKFNLNYFTSYSIYKRVKALAMAAGNALRQSLCQKEPHKGENASQILIDRGVPEGEPPQRPPENYVSWPERQFEMWKLVQPPDGYCPNPTLTLEEFQAWIA